MASRIRATEVLAGRGVPFVFLTGYAPGNIPERFRDRPALRKPWTCPLRVEGWDQNVMPRPTL